MGPAFDLAMAQVLPPRDGGAWRPFLPGRPTDKWGVATRCGAIVCVMCSCASQLLEHQLAQQYARDV